MFGNLMKGLVQSAPAACYDLQTGRLGVRNSNGFGTYDPPVEATTGKSASKGKYKTCSVKEFAISVPAFSIRTPVDEIKAGDLVVIGDGKKAEYYFFVSCKKDGELDNPTISGINTENGKITNIVVPDQAFLPGFGILTVKNLFSTAGGINSIMPLMMLMKQDVSGGDTNDSFGKFLMLSSMCGGNINSVFGQTTGDAAGGIGSMLPMMMMMSNGFKGGMKDLMMMQMLTGNQGDMSKILPMIALMGSLDDESSDSSSDSSNAIPDSDWINKCVVLINKENVKAISNIKLKDNNCRADFIEDFKDYGGTIIEDHGKTFLIETYSNYGTFEINKSEVKEEE